MTKNLAALFLASAFSAAAARAASLADGIIDPSRSIDWSQTGVEGGIPNRNQICATLNPGATVAQINAAISSCPENQVVYLNAGSYSLSGGINLMRNVTLRGAGADQTFLTFTAATACGGLSASICFLNGNPNYNGNPANTANWTAGYAKGTTVITLSNTNNLAAGTPLILDQENDSNTDTGGIWVCGRGGENACCVSCASGAGRPGPPPRDQTQVVRVSAVNGNQVTIEDPLYMPNWTAGKNPGAWWSSAVAISGAGIEDLSMDHSGSGGTTGVTFFNANGSWIKGVRSINSNRSHVWIFQSARITVRDSYFYGTQNAADQSYGIELFTASSNLIENNIFQHIAAPMMTNNGGGSVFAYNHSFDDYFSVSPDAAMASMWQHGAGISYHLYEGNVASVGLRADYFHGLSHFTTAFRNRYRGFESLARYQMSSPVMLQMGHRYFNVVGNVLGDDSYHNAYTVAAGDNSANCNSSIFSLGWGGYCAPGTSLADDQLVQTTLLRWGNYDTVNDAVRFVSTEAPSGLGAYANPVPANQTLPASFYLSAKPSWWPGTIPWPPIGPDVTGGTISGVGGHANKIPAQVCHESAAVDPAYGADNVILFNAAACYGDTYSTPSPGNLRFAAASSNVNETGGTLVLTVNRVSGSVGAVTVDYATANGTAAAGSDYTAASGTLSWADGDAAAKTITINIADDAIVEGTETFTITLSNPTGGAALGAVTSATVNILDDEAPPDATPPTNPKGMKRR